MRHVFHSSELIPYDVREIDPFGDLPPHDQAHLQDLLPEDEEELAEAVDQLFPPPVDGESVQADLAPKAATLDQDFHGQPPPSGYGTTQSTTPWTYWNTTTSNI